MQILEKVINTEIVFPEVGIYIGFHIEFPIGYSYWLLSIAYEVEKKHEELKEELRQAISALKKQSAPAPQSQPDTTEAT